MKPLALDVETETYNKGNPFDKRNRLVCFSYAYEAHADAGLWGELTSDEVQEMVDSHDLIVGFNFKFDYHWLANNGVDFRNKRIWDVQTAHYILSNQTDIFPSLNDVLVYYGLPTKPDVVKQEYWDNGFQTSEIPWAILHEYASYDAEGTLAAFNKQWQQATPNQRALILLDGQDTHVLREMEYNGIKYDPELCNKRAEEISERIKDINKELQSYSPTVSINFNSGDQLSAFLYGGTIEEVVKEHDGFFKSGQKKGQPKLKNKVVTHTLPGFYKPIPGSGLAKAGYYATNEPTLRKLKGNQKIVNLLLELAKLDKLNGTYYLGIPQLNEEMNWEHGILHSNFNQTQTKTGRLSSNKPNQQNFSGDILDIFLSRV